MKAPNAKTSMQNLKLAKELLKNAYEDLKNDPSVRDEKIHSQLYLLEKQIAVVENDLVELGYTKA